MVKCVSEWSNKAILCNGNTQCLEECAKDLRKCLDNAFPFSKDIEIESDKINYILSSVFFLTNRLAKASIGLAEFDASIAKLEQIGKSSLEKTENREQYERFENDVDNILSEYF